jgi:DNA-binding response OmpR family regulator
MEMPRKLQKDKTYLASPASVLLIEESSPSLQRRQQSLEISGFAVTRAENICYAEIFAGSQHFDAAIYDDSVPTEEQHSLARTMRLHWPWMRLVSCAAPPQHELSRQLFDANQSSALALPKTLREIL